MGHKVHPMGFRLGVIKGWQSRWFADKNYKELVGEDIAIRKHILEGKDFANGGIARVEIERVAGTQITVTIFTSKPGIIIGRNGEKMDRLRLSLEKLTKKKVHTKTMEIRNPEVEAILVANSIAEQLEKRISFRRAMKQAVQKTMKAGAKGIKVMCAGRLGGAEIARTEREVEGSVPLQTLRADIDFAIGVAHTTYGTIGIKVWIYRGDILTGNRRQTPTGTEASADRPRREDRPRRDDRPRREGSDRNGPRRDGGGDRGPRRDGGGSRPMGDRPMGARPMGDRPMGDRPMGDRAPRPPMGDRPLGDRPPRPPMGDRPLGDRAPRPPMGDRPPRPQGEQSARPAAGPVNAPTEGAAPTNAPTEPNTPVNAQPQAEAATPVNMPPQAEAATQVNTPPQAEAPKPVQPVEQNTAAPATTPTPEQKPETEE